MAGLTFGEIYKDANDALAALNKHGDAHGSLEAQADLWRAVKVALECIVAAGGQADKIMDAFSKKPVDGGSF